MVSLLNQFILLACLNLSLALLPPNYLFRANKILTNYTYKYSPTFDYPLFHIVDKDLAGISNETYAGTFYTGYIPVDNERSHIYYVLYPAGGDNNPEANLNNSAPLLLWMQGGPGCSDWIGNFGEIGPFTVVRGPDGKIVPTKIPINWNTKYNLLFIDQPPGVGFSPTGSTHYSNSMQAGKAVIKFLEGFYDIYTSLKLNRFYIVGESYGGHYVPAVSSQIVQNNTRLQINLAGIGIVDGLTDCYHQGTSYASFGYAAGFIDDRSREPISKMEMQASQEFAKGNFSGVAGIFDKIMEVMVNPKTTGLHDPFNYRDNPSERQYSPYSDYFKISNVRKAFAMDPATEFHACTDAMYYDFYPDIGQSFAPNITYLLDHGVPVLIINGQDDLIINTPGARNWISHLDWAFIEQFEHSESKILTDSQRNELGTVKSAHGLTFSVVYKAGHAVPAYQPVASQILIDSLINNHFSTPIKLNE